MVRKSGSTKATVDLKSIRVWRFQPAPRPDLHQRSGGGDSGNTSLMTRRKACGTLDVLPTSPRFHRVNKSIDGARPFDGTGRSRLITGPSQGQHGDAEGQGHAADGKSRESLMTKAVADPERMKLPKPPEAARIASPNAPSPGLFRRARWKSSSRRSAPANSASADAKASSGLLPLPDQIVDFRPEEILQLGQVPILQRSLALKVPFPPVYGFFQVKHGRPRFSMASGCRFEKTAKDSVDGHPLGLFISKLGPPEVGQPVISPKSFVFDQPPRGFDQAVLLHPLQDRVQAWARTTRAFRRRARARAE